MSFIEVRDIHKSYRRREVLRGASLYAEHGECIGIVGANGCGKSTLLGILSGASGASSGSIFYDGHDALKERNIFTHYAGFVPQDNPLLSHLSVYDNLRFWYCGTGRSLADDMADGILAQFGLNAYRNYDVSKLSGGIKKRLSIACAIAQNPQILILDEPGASLDIVCKEDIKNYLRSYTASGNTVLITSHETGELELCDRIYLLAGGRLTELEFLRRSVRGNTDLADTLIQYIRIPEERR